MWLTSSRFSARGSPGPEVTYVLLHQSVANTPASLARDAGMKSAGHTSKTRCDRVAQRGKRAARKVVGHATRRVASGGWEVGKTEEWGLRIESAVSVIRRVVVAAGGVVVVAGVVLLALAGVEGFDVVDEPGVGI